MDQNLINYINVQIQQATAQQNQKQSMQAWQQNIMMQHQQQQLMLQFYTYQKLLALQTAHEGGPPAAQAQPMVNMTGAGSPMPMNPEALLRQMQLQQQMMQQQGQQPPKVISPLPHQNMAHFSKMARVGMPPHHPRVATAAVAAGTPSVRRSQMKSVAELGYGYVETMDSGKVASMAEDMYAFPSTSQCGNNAVRSSQTTTSCTTAPVNQTVFGNFAPSMRPQNTNQAVPSQSTISTEGLRLLLAESQRQMGLRLPTILAKSPEVKEIKSEPQPSDTRTNSNPSATVSVKSEPCQMMRSPLGRVPSLQSGYSSAFSPVSSGSSGSSCVPPELSPQSAVAVKRTVSPAEVIYPKENMVASIPCGPSMTPPELFPEQPCPISKKKSQSSDDGDDEMFVDVESVEEGPVGKARRNAYILYYRTMRSISNSFRDSSLHCAICDQTVQNNDNSISDHVQEHCEGGGYRCRICGVEHRQKYRMYAHMREKHEKKPTAFDDRRDMVHMQVKLMECFPKAPNRTPKTDFPAEASKAMKTMSKQIKCSLCDATFSNTKKAISKHAEMHELLKCSTCGYTSLSLDSQNSHQHDSHGGSVDSGKGFQPATKSQIICSILHITEQ